MSFTEKIKNAQKESKGREVFTMPFGKYKDKLLKDIPDNYLRYAVDNFDGLDMLSMGYLKEELLNREIDPRKKVRDDFNYKKDYTYKNRRERLWEEVLDDLPSIKPKFNGDLEEQINSLFRKLSRKYHPDRGGSDKEMAVVNNLKEEFIKLLKIEGIIE